MKPKAVVFYTYLPPWRIDVFNEMGKYYDLTIVFLNANAVGFTYDRQLLLDKLNVNSIFIDNGFIVGSKPFRFGIYKLLKRLMPDIVFSHEYSPTSLYISFLLKLNLLSFRYIITTSDNLLMAQSVKGIKSIARAYILKSANGIIVYSESVKQWYKQKFPTLKIEICPNIQNPASLLQYKPEFKLIIDKHKKKFNIFDTNIILYTGRLEKVKGLYLLLNAFSKSNNIDFKLVIVGDGNEKAELIKLSNTLNLKDKVIFAGYYDLSELYAWYEMANFFILPSIFEPFGAVVNESLVFGCPVLASKYIGALDYIEENQNGFVFDPLNETEFINTLNNAMKEYKEKKYNRNNLMKFSFKNYVKSFERINL